MFTPPELEREPPFAQIIDLQVDLLNFSGVPMPGIGPRPSEILRRLLVPILFAAALGPLLGGCTTLRRTVIRMPSVALADPSSTRLGRALEPGERAHPGQSAFAVLSYGQESLVARMALADAAERTIDAQYYIYSSDAAGSLFLQHLLAAAARGVRVRLLLDDYNLGNDRELAALCTIPNVEIRIFNPVSFRAKWARLPEYALSFGHADKRMHNKLLIADNAFSILGGRNIGDEYFNLGGVDSFRDFDLIAGGPITRSASVAFDEYWDSSWAIPATALVSKRPSPAYVRAMLRRIAARARPAATFEKQYEALRGQYLANLLREPSSLAWARGEIVCDRPPTAGQPGTESALVQRLNQEWQAARKEVLIESAYFLPSKQGIDTFRELSQRGVTVKLLTSALSTTDVPFVYCAYESCRKPLLEAGVQLYEYRVVNPAPTHVKRPWYRAGRSYALLHSKVMVFDRRRVWIGSLNLDPRSIRINTEIAAIIDSRALADQVAVDIEADMAPDRSWRLVLEPNGRIAWTGTVNGVPVVRYHQPGNWLRRIDTFLLRIFPGIRNQL